ncbi:MAG: MoxR family ATPase [Burkholderiales bacterium]|nr:MoxR family ATPase [Burkholderiales bacterium]
MDIQPVIDQVSSVILGKREQIRLAIACMLAGGHLLIEDLPGVGKTTLAHALANSLGLEFRRIQFTSDMLPADILGASVYDRETSTFRFHPGPIFANLILADEINRTTPKTQSAILEAMEERQVTSEGETRPLPEPFFVIATQNPTDQVGTFPLPESQLDRFMMRIRLGYPDPAAEKELLSGISRRDLLSTLSPAMDKADLVVLQEKVGKVKVSSALIDYLQAILNHSRTHPEFVNGLSPRAGLGLLSASRAWAYLGGRDLVIPEDLQAVLPSVVDHRLIPARDYSRIRPSEMLLTEVAIP